MVLCLLSRGSHGKTGKLNHEETVRGPEIAIFPEKSEILLLLILVKILKKSDSSHTSSKGHRRHADRLREPDPTTLWYLQIGPEVERIC